MKLAECEIVGAMAAPRGNAPFDRANLVLKCTHEGNGYLQVRAYLSPDGVDGKALTAEEWQALLQSEQAIEIGPMEAEPSAVLWILRPSFDGRDGALEELRTSRVLLHDKFMLPDGSFGCLLSEREAAVHDLRDRWAEEAFAEALQWAKSNHWQRARTAATRAFVLERALSAERVAMLALTHERCRNAVRANGYIEMARRSRGADFAEQVLEKRLYLAQLTQGERPRCAGDIYKASREHTSAGRARVARVRAA